jgi:hypothetical protein
MVCVVAPVLHKKVLPALPASKLAVELLQMVWSLPKSTIGKELIVIWRTLESGQSI